MSPTQTFLHVGCGPNRKAQTTLGFNTDAWQEMRLDIDPAVAPDIVGTMTDMSAVVDASVDAVFSSHNLEHLYAYQVPMALAEFLRVLKPDGFLVLTCPDLQSVCALVAQDRLIETAYSTASGPISALDILYGHRPALADGNHYMAHKCGFTQRVLTHSLQNAGFATVAAARRAGPFFDLWAVGCKTTRSDSAMKELAMNYFPGMAG